MRKSLILGISVLAMAGILWGNGKEVETQRETAAFQRFAVSCQWTVLEEDEAKQMDETWYQFSEGAVSLEYPDYFDLDFRCADYAGERLLVMNQTDGLGKRRPSVFFSREKI